MVKITLILLVFIVELISGESLKDYYYTKPAKDGKENEKFLAKEHFLDLYNKRSEIKDILRKDLILKREFKEVNNITISKTPLRKPLKTLDTVMPHPQYGQMLLYPEGYTVLKADCFPKGHVEDQKDANMLELFPTKDLVAATIHVILEKDGKKYTNKLFVERYYENKVRDSIYYPVIEYTDASTLDDFEILEIYRKKHGDYPMASASIIIDGAGYNIINDRINGNIKIGSRNFRIERVQ